MIHQNYDYVAKRWRQYWNFENHDRPLLNIYAPREHQTKPDFTVPKDVKTRWLDVDYVIRSSRWSMENTYYGGEAFPALCPNLGPDITGAVCGGCDIAFGPDTSWAIHGVSDWEQFPEIRFDENNIWWKRIAEMTEQVAKDARSDYIVGITDLHPGTDGLVSLRGPQELCIDLIDAPQEVKKRLDEIFRVHTVMYRKLQSIIRKVQPDDTNWTGMLHPEESWYPVSSDFSCLIGKEDYETFVAPGIEQETEFYSKSIYHLDGPGALHHLERILKMEHLTAVQWVYGAGQPSARHWIDILQKIQNAGKGIQVQCFAQDLVDVCQALRPEGVDLIYYADTEEEAKAAVRTVEEIYRDKRAPMVSLA